MLTSGTSFDSNSAVSVVPSAGHDGTVFTIPDAHFLFKADFTRTGSDLTLTGEDGQRLVVPDYFRHERLPTLLTPDGAALTGDVVEALAGSRTPGQYAQAAGAPAPSDAQPIGRVASVSGNATAVRNGVAVALNVGDAVYKGDVIQTGTSSAVGVIFGDASTFNLTSNARMVLNEFVYNPAPGSANSAFINLVQGSITFLAGEVAHTGDMKVGTPVATMGIRGTAVHVDINVSGTGETKMSVLVEPGNVVGSFYIYSLSGALIGTVNNANGVTIVTPVGPLQAVANELQQTPTELAQSFVVMQQVFQTQAVGQAILAAQPVPPSQVPGGPTPPPPGGQPNATGPLTTIQTTDMSSVHVTVDVTTTSTQTQVESVTSSPGTPFVVPLSLTQPIPFQPVLAQQTALQITAQPNTPLIEATQVSPGISGSLTVLTLTGDSPTFDVTALIAAGWQDIGNGVFSKTGTFGTAALSTTSGTVTYVLDNNRDQTQALRPGDVEHDEFVIPVTDNSGSSSFTVDFTVNGSNDAPVVSATVNPTPHIQTVNHAANVVDAGVTVSDVDSPNLAGATVTIAAGAQSGDTLTINGATSGVITVSGGQQIQFSYDSTNHVLLLSGAASQADYQDVLRTVSFSNTGDNVANSTRTIAFQVDDGSADDNVSNVATATIVLNHLPAGVADDGAIAEDAASTVVSGNVLSNDTDIDGADTHTVSALAGATDNGTTFIVVGTYGTLVVDKATGAYTYTLANGQANVQALAAGQTVTDVFDYANSDNNGGSGSSTLTIRVTGSNDAPVVVADDGAVTEDAASTVVSGNVLSNDTDIDTADTHTVSALAGATDNGTTFTVVGTYGTLVVDKATGAYTYTLANGQANVQALAAGQTVTDVFNYTNADNHSGSGSSTLTISIHGGNDAPTVDLTPIITEVPIPDLAQHPGTNTAAQDLFGPAVSQDGRWVVFFSDQGTPGPDDDDTTNDGDVFLYDRLTGVTTVLTDDAHILNRPAGEHYSGFSISADGSNAVFRGSQVVNGEFGPSEIDHVYVYDRGTDTTRVLTNPDDGHVYGVNDQPRIAGGNLIVFAETLFSTSGPPSQHLRVTDLGGHIVSDLTLGTLGISDPNQADPSHSLQFVQPDISPNGRFLTFWTVEHQTTPGNGGGGGTFTPWETPRSTPSTVSPTPSRLSRPRARATTLGWRR